MIGCIRCKVVISMNRDIDGGLKVDAGGVKASGADDRQDEFECSGHWCEGLGDYDREFPFIRLSEVGGIASHINYLEAAFAFEGILDFGEEGAHFSFGFEYSQI